MPCMAGSLWHADPCCGQVLCPSHKHTTWDLAQGWHMLDTVGSALRFQWSGR